MFSYRHAFHAGNHADVLKHTILIALVRYLTQKDAALTVVDTHAGAGLYRLDGDYARTSAEASDGLLRLLATGLPESELLRDYAEQVLTFNANADVSQGQVGGLRVYPGSPFLVQQLLRPHDRLRLFELHPTDARALRGNIQQLNAGRQISLGTEDGFESLRKLLPPPSRRALVLCDPSYELKSDYGRVATLIEEALQRFPTGTYAVWYPVIPRREAHELPRRLKTLAQRAGRAWLHAALATGGGRTEVSERVSTQLAGQRAARPGLTASGMFIINPPFTLAEALRPALVELKSRLGQGPSASTTLESAG
jgi:23S rRNA (adenine2030-N6)-methyltransferase